MPTWSTGQGRAEPQPHRRLGAGGWCSAPASLGFALDQLGLLLPPPQGLLLGIDEAWLHQWFANFIFSRERLIKRIPYIDTTLI